MLRYIGGFVLISLLTVKALDHYSELQGYQGEKSENTRVTTTPETVAKLNVKEVEPEPFSYTGRRATIKMDARGHFVTTARMNGRRVEVLVDTGATSVAINRSTARRLGIFLKASDFKYTVNTANGATKAASAFIDRIEIGRVTVKDVRAAILDDKALDGTLLGMTFLGQLQGFEVKNRQLILTQ